jgi:hypothetical protein
MFPITEFTLDRVPIVNGNPSYLAPFATKIFDREEHPIECYSYIGGIAERFEASEYLHEIGHGMLKHGEAEFSVVYICLFSNLATPIYVVVTGYKI